MIMLQVAIMLTRFFFFQLEMKQRYLVGKLNVPNVKEGGPDEVTVETLGKDFSLSNAKLQPFLLWTTLHSCAYFCSIVSL